MVLRRGDTDSRRVAIVSKVLWDGAVCRLSVKGLAAGDHAVLNLSDVRCGFPAGADVVHEPSVPGESFGIGVVLQLRKLGGAEQVLVEFADRSTRLWLPYERLRFAKGAQFRFRNVDRGGPAAAERFRLKCLAHALVLWNENTGALARFDIDPLPHQIHVVHHILASGNLNWLIADDVGLGKTIEAGMLIAALRQRRLARRVLLVVPAGLTRQWQDDLKSKFGMDAFEIYGTDFRINDPAHWKLHDLVIASMDLLKSEPHLGVLLAAPAWDVVVFDEAHRLSQRQYGMEFKSSDRYRLAEALRSRTEHLLFLTATPHQGMADKFLALLKLLRPGWLDEIQNLDSNPALLRQMVFRNRKADVTDMEGNFVFHGQTSKVVRVDSTPAARALDGRLRDYFLQGYAAAERASGRQGRAIGFVMTVYRKLAASSLWALHGALQRRIEKLRTRILEEPDDEVPEDHPFQGELEELHVGGAHEFFAGEIDALYRIIHEVDENLKNDRKLAAFLEEIIAPILRQNPQERVLIFSEYRGTQDYVREALAKLCGAAKVELINGSMDVEERRAAIARFEETGQFLLSTEAGGEGINLQRRCHILVNYDLPWNPMRLAQRIGRLYRYGQRRHVVAFNLRANQTIDEEIVALMYEKLEAIAAQMAPVSDEYSSNFHADVLGELADLAEVEAILEASKDRDINRTAERIDEALQRAKDSANLQHELFHHAASFDAQELRSGLAIGPRHVEAFVVGMIELYGGTATARREPIMSWRISLGDTLRSHLPGSSASLDVTFDREVARFTRDLTMLDLDHPLVLGMIDVARDYDFEGLTAGIEYPGPEAVIAAVARWQNERGLRMRQEFVAMEIQEEGAVFNSASFSEYLLVPAVVSHPSVDRARSEHLRGRANEALDAVLAKRSNASLLPESATWLAAAWCGAGSGRADD